MKYLIIFLAKLITALPFRMQLALGSGLGAICYFLMKKRRFVAMRNLEHCFPEFNDQERKKLCFKSFQSTGMGVMEGLAAWFMSERRIQKIPFTWIGKEHYEAALKTDKGILALSGHFSCIEMIGRIFGKFIPSYCVYKPSRNQIADEIITQGRLRYALGLLKHSNMKAMISALRGKKLIWFAPDQDFGRVRAEFVPFCGIPAATIVAASILTKMGDAVVLPMFFRRTKTGYELIIYPHWENFPSGNDYEDCKRYNDLLTEFVKEYPDQYLWIHRRFKTAESGDNIYKK